MKRFANFLISISILFTATAYELTFLQECSYETSNTNFAEQNYETCSVVGVCPGDALIFDGCSCQNDTYFRLYDESNTQLSFSDDAGCNFCSKIVYRSYLPTCQNISLHMGCSGDSSCSGLVMVFKNLSIPATIVANFKGEYSQLNIIVAPGDTVNFTATYLPFSISSPDFNVDDVSSYMHTYKSLGSYPFSISDSAMSDSGIVAVRIPEIYDSSNFYYYLNPGDFLRWQWNASETLPTYPTYFYGQNSNPGMSRSGSTYYDYIFALPGYYYWYTYNSSELVYNYYYVWVYDPFSSDHQNVKWGSNMDSYHIYNDMSKMLVFYASDGNKQNVRIYNSKNRVVWVSNDLSLPGDHDSVVLPPGTYYATSDYNTMVYATIYCSDKKEDDNNGLTRFLPKSVIRAAEISLFIMGVIGLTDVALDFARTNTPKVPNPMGDQISINALNGAEEEKSINHE